MATPRRRRKTPTDKKKKQERPQSYRTKARDELDESLVVDFCTKIEKGLSFKAVCNLLSVPYATAQEWLKFGRTSKCIDGTDIKKTFYLSVQAARAMGEEGYLDKLAACNTPTWARFSFILKTAYSYHWGDRSNDEIEKAATILLENDLISEEKAEDISSVITDARQSIKEIISPETRHPKDGSD